MVSLPLLIALLTLIDVTRSFEYFIDLKRCELVKQSSEMICYVRESCVDTSISGDPNVLVKYKNEKLKDDTCDVIVQMKAFTRFRYHVMMQVNVSASESPLDELDTNSGISIVHNKSIIKCSSSEVTGNVVFDGKYGTRQIFSKNLIFCSTILKSLSTTIVTVFEKEPFNAEFPRLEFLKANNQENLYYAAKTGNKFWYIVDTTCDDTLIISSNKTTDEYLYTQIDSAYIHPHCPERQYIMLDHNSKMVMASTLSCDLDRSQWKFKIEETEIFHPLGTPFFAYCAIKFSEICEPTPLLFLTCSGCTEPTPIGNDTFKCDGNKWRMSDGSVDVTEVKCKRKGNERTSAWQTNEGKFITEGACSAEFDCATFNKLNFTVPEKDNVHVYKAVDQIGDGNRLNCSEGFNLAYISSDGATKIIDEDLVCDTENGFFYPEGHSKKQDKQTNNTSSVFCAKRQIAPPEKDPQSGALSPVVLGASIGGGIVAVLISMCIIGLFLRVRYLKRKAHEYNHERELQEMETAKEINTAKEMIVVDKRNQWTLENLRNEQRIRAIVAERLMEEMRVKRLSGN